jgi:hypothetical protein
MRYFKEPMSFSYGQHLSKLLRLENVPIAYHVNPSEESMYGDRYAYAAFPPDLRGLISRACNRQRGTDVDDNSLGGETSEGWWKTISFKTHAFEDKRQGVKLGNTTWSLRRLLESTRKGVLATLLIVVNLKANFEDERQKHLQRPLTKDIPGMVEIEVRKGYVTRSEVDMSPVPYIPPRNRSRSVPVVIIEFVEEDIMDELKRLKLGNES